MAPKRRKPTQYGTPVMAAARLAGLLLTGGASRRMGVDKATLPAPGGRETLAGRTARLLLQVTPRALELGPGYSDLPAVTEPEPGLGPLVALAGGLEALHQRGWDGPVLVLATDLPRLSASFLAELAAHPATRSVVPRADGRPQPLCARYQPDDLARTVTLAGEGKRAMRDLLAVIDPLYVDADPDGIADVDTPADLDRLERLAAADRARP